MRIELFAAAGYLPVRVPVFFFAGRLEAISDPRFGVDVARVARVGLDFFSQLIDEHAQIFGFFAVIRAPDGLQQAAVTERFALIRNELAQQLEFFRRETDGCPSP